MIEDALRGGDARIYSMLNILMICSSEKRLLGITVPNDPKILTKHLALLPEVGQFMNLHQQQSS